LTANPKNHIHIRQPVTNPYPTQHMTPDQPSSATRDHIAHPEGRFSLIDEGEGPCIVGIHGLPGSVRDFRWLAPCLTDGARFVRLDMPGFGETKRELGWPAAADAARHIIRVLDHLELDQVVLAAHSFGATQAVATATHHPDRVAGLALLSPVGFRPHRGLRRLVSPGLLERGLRVPVVNRPLMKLLKKGYRAAGFKNVTGDDVAHTLGSLRELSWDDYRNRAQRIQQPALCAWADDDAVIETDISLEVAATLPEGPRLGFETGGHNIQKTRAVEIADALLPWTEDVLAR
jgi:pimeloyl-ACP methyl ester carboxylesterase